MHARHGPHRSHGPHGTHGPHGRLHLWPKDLPDAQTANGYSMYCTAGWPTATHCHQQPNHKLRGRSTFAASCSDPSWAETSSVRLGLSCGFSWLIYPGNVESLYSIVEEIWNSSRHFTTLVSRSEAAAKAKAVLTLVPQSCWGQPLELWQWLPVGLGAVGSAAIHNPTKLASHLSQHLALTAFAPVANFSRASR